MISQKENSTECNPFYVSKAELEALDYILYLKDMVRMLNLELLDLKREVKQKSVVFDESCDERYAEDWRET